MPIILATKNFTVKAHDEPHHSRENGGHVVITPLKKFHHRHEMPLDLADELMHLTMVVGKAFTNIMKSKGIDVIRINYQDNGNWAYKEPKKEPHLHIHLYMRAANEKHPTNDNRFQAFPDGLVFPDKKTGYYELFKPLTNEDCADIKTEVIRLLRTDEYKPIELNIIDVTSGNNSLGW